MISGIFGASAFTNWTIPSTNVGNISINASLTLLNTLVIVSTNASAPPVPFKKLSNNVFIDCCNYFEKIGFDSTIYTNVEKVLNLWKIY
jgi:hypothetical protein